VLEVPWLFVVQVPAMKMPTPSKKKKVPTKLQPKSRQRKLGKDNGKVVDLGKAKARFLAIYSDPQDLRDEQDIAKELGVLPSQLAAWRNQPSFFEPGSQAFDRALRGSLVPLKKTLLKQAIEHRSQAAINRVLEMVGVLEGRGSKINILNVSGAPHQDTYLEKLTDEELDNEIALRLHATTQGDVVLANGKVVAAAEILDAEYKELDCLDYSAGRRRVDTKRS